MSLQSVTLSGSQRDALLISFKDAKLSVVQHDPDTFDLKTLSLHYFEEDDIKVILYHLNVTATELNRYTFLGRLEWKLPPSNGPCRSRQSLCSDGCIW